ncbi:MAG TPA: tripartite tricarboxylate transporter substrate-binding protein [Caldimonas sp.]
MKAHVILIAAVMAGVACGAYAQWKPTRPINLIVPWAAGGSTDQVTRVTAAELEKALGQTIVIVNQPGASGSIGTKSALDAAKDGYTWTAGAAQDLGTYETLGSLKTRVTDWNLFLTVANIQARSRSAPTSSSGSRSSASRCPERSSATIPLRAG